MRLKFHILNGSRGDLVIFDINEKLHPPKKDQKHPPPKIVGECKLYKEENIGKSIFDKIIVKFENKNYKSTEIFLVAAQKFVETNKFVHENYCIWIFNRKSSCLVLKTVNKFQNEFAKKHVFLIGLTEIYSGEDKSLLEMRTAAFQRA